MFSTGKDGLVIKGRILIIAAAIMVFSAGAAFSVSKDRQLKFVGSGFGNVIFNGSIHAGVGKVCEDCHNLDAFPMQKKGVANISMEDILEGNYCGFCHNGKIAFEVDSHCAICHRQ